MRMHCRGICQNHVTMKKKIIIEPVINHIRENNSGSLNISGMGLEKLTIEKVRQLHKHDLFYGKERSYASGKNVSLEEKTNMCI